jgi:hypothetical protein
MTTPARPAGPPPLTPAQTNTLEKVVGQLILNIDLIASNFKSRGSAAEADIKKILKKNKTNPVALALQPMLKPLLNSAKRAQDATKVMKKVFDEFEKKKAPYAKVKAEIDKADREHQVVVGFAEAFMNKGSMAKGFGVGVSSVLAMCDAFPKKAEVTSKLIDTLPAR